MLSKKQRIPRELFTELLLRSKYANSEHFSLRYRTNTDKTARFGVSVSKKVSKSAVTRNTIRRRVYSTLRSILSSFPPGLFLFVAKPKTQTLKIEKLLEEIKILINSIN